MEIVSDFQPGQIVYLEHGDRRLYAEVIQVVLSRQSCWVRPLLLVVYSWEPPLTRDLRAASDLLWPLNLFQPALDTEIISILSEVLAKEAKLGIDTITKQQLNQFIYQVWHAYKKDNGPT
ncbi:hypothetical protein QUB80_09365 [Chlorogloeopsis sp. ULAP01]|uniref:hypothetical protein n=1 Tax=Chlorogloeopsis sp. ULAP01 TaxID=3056483 RepID=UPI0025AA6048|nr:hypothetical protein [Chlorogloeopsis sp. ULAP01]MDM9380911.1 hypothetical protein [Chlorogloeopsis sp. ULAP01]